MSKGKFNADKSEGQFGFSSNIFQSATGNFVAALLIVFLLGIIQVHVVFSEAEPNGPLLYWS